MHKGCSGFNGYWSGGRGLKKYKYNPRHIILVILLIFIAALAMTFVKLSFSMRSVNAVSERETLKMLTQNAEQIKQVMDNQIDKKWDSLDMAAAALSNVDGLTEKQAVDFFENTISDEYIVWLMTKDGYYLKSDGSTGQAKLTGQVRSMLENGESLCSLYPYGYVDTLRLAKPIPAILVEDHQMEYMFVYFKLNTFMSLLSIDSFGDDSGIRIIDKSGATVLQPAGAEKEEKGRDLFSQYETAEFQSADGNLDFTEFCDYVISGKSGAVHVIGKGGRGEILSFTKVRNLDWYVIVTRDYDKVLGAQRKNIKQITSTAQAAVFFIILFAVIMSVSLMIWNERKMYRKNLELEEINAKLSAVNASLEQAKEVSEQALKVAEAANRAKSFFLSNMSHDIRTPMNAVVGFAALLSQNAENPKKVREYTKKITFSSQHLLGIINDVLDMSKMESGRTILSLTKESVTDIIDEMSASIRPQLAAKEQTLEVKYIILSTI